MHVTADAMDLPATEWKEFQARVDGRVVSYRFPAPPEAEISASERPSVDPYGKERFFVTSRVGLRVGLREIDATYILNLSLNPAPRSSVGKAKSATKLLSEYEEFYSERIKGASPGNTIAKMRVSRFGQLEWAHFSFIDQTRAPSMEKYYAPWVSDEILTLTLIYGRQTAGDPDAVRGIRDRAEQVLASMVIRQE